MSDFATDLQIHAYTLLSNGDKFSGEKMKRAAAEIARLTEALAAHEEAATDKRRLVREIDVIMHGDEAAQQASLCDLVGPIRDMVAALAAMTEERDEADRVAGALNREVADLKEAAAKRREWLWRAKKERGYDDATSFDVVWKDVCEKADALAASEEARRAERAAVVRECAEKADCGCKEDRSDCLGVSENMGLCYRDGVADILALATDADNAALDKLLREARMEGMERAALAVTERADQENEFAAIHGELENNSKAREAARVVTTLRGVAAHIRILAALEAPQ